MPYKRVRNAAYWREYRKQKRQEMANKFPKKTPKTAAQRQRECRNRKKLAMLATSAAGNSGNVPETAAQHETECRKRLDMLAASVVDSSGNVPKTAAQRQRECRNRKKLAMLGISVVGNSGNGPKTTAQRQRECRTRKKLAAIINNARVTNENGTSIQWMQEGKEMYYADNNLVERRSCTSFPAVVLHHNMDIVEVTPDLSSMNIVKEEPDANNESESEYSQGADQFYDVKKEKEGNEDEEHLRDSQAGEENNMEEVKLEPYLEVKTEQSPTFNSYNFDNDVKIQDTERQEEYEMGSIKEDPLMINSDANEGINEYASVSIKETEKPLLKNEIKEEVWESLDVKEEIKCEIMKDDLQQNSVLDLANTAEASNNGLNSPAQLETEKELYVMDTTDSSLGEKCSSQERTENLRHNVERTAELGTKRSETVTQPDQITENLSTNDNEVSEIDKNNTVSNECEHKGKMLQITTTSGGEGIWKCELCDSRFTVNETFEKYIQTCPGNKSWMCNICSTAFSHHLSYTRHLQTHGTGTPWQCIICGLGSKQYSSFEKHVISHNIKNPWQCHVCSSGFTAKEALQKHLLSHNEKKPWHCSRCDQRFTKKSGLLSHISTHDEALVSGEGIDSWRCSQCNKNFRKRGALRKHQRKQHSLVTENKWRCDICSETFTCNMSFKKHFQSHEEQVKWKCDVCGKRYVRKMNLKAHIQKHLKEATPRLVTAEEPVK